MTNLLPELEHKNPEYFSHNIILFCVPYLRHNIEILTQVYDFLLCDFKIASTVCVVCFLLALSKPNVLHMNSNRSNSIYTYINGHVSSI
jgi:uncharacterized membrane protein YwaF